MCQLAAPSPSHVASGALFPRCIQCPRHIRCECAAHPNPADLPVAAHTCSASVVGLPLPPRLIVAQGRGGSMEAVQESVLQGRFGDAAEQLEEAELRAEDAALATWPYVLQVLLYLAEGETEMARLAWKRMPPVMQSSGEAQEVHGLLRALWQRDLSAAWGAMPRISRLLEGAALARIQARLREEAVNAIEEAYAAIDVGTACAMCGVEPLQLNELAERCGWRSEGDVLVISRRAPSKVEGAGLVDLKALSQYVVKLE